MPTVEYETPATIVPFKTDSLESHPVKIKSFAPLKREAAIRRRLRPSGQTQEGGFQILPMMNALKEGKLPNNEQMCHFLNELIHSPLLKENEAYLSLQGLGEWRNLQEWFKVSISMINQKNANSEFQKFLFHSRLAAQSLSTTPLPGTDHLKEIVSTELNLLENLQKTALTLVFNSQSRDSLVKLFGLVREMFSEFEPTKEGTEYLKKLTADESSEKQKGSGIDTPTTIPLNHPPTEEEKESLKTEKKVSFLPGYQLSIEHRRDLIKQFQMILHDIHKDPKSSDMFSFLLKTARQFEIQIREHVLSEMTIQAQVDQAFQDKKTLDANVKESLSLLKTIISHLANEKSLDPLFDSFLSVKKCLENDFELRELLDDLLSFCERSFNDKTYTNHPDSYEKGVHLIGRGREVLFDKHNQQIESVFKEFESFLKAFQQDELTSDWIDKGKQFSLNLFESVNGKMHFNSFILRDSLVIFMPVCSYQLINV